MSKEDGGVNEMMISSEVVGSSGADNATGTTIVVAEGSVIPTSNHTEVADSILFPWFVQLLGCLSLFVIERCDLAIPYAAVMFIWGAIMGFIIVHQEDPMNNRNMLFDSITMYINIDSSVLLLIFLPALLFKDAVEIHMNLFLVGFWQIFIMAVPMVFVGTAVMAVACKYCLGYDSWAFGWLGWITLGALLAATDPIAVSSVLSTAGAAPRLVTHIAGESLLNDGSSYVLFVLSSELWYSYVGLPLTHPAYSMVGTLLFFLQMSVGGAVVGAGFGFVLVACLWELDRRLERSFDVVQVVFGLGTAYVCYFFSDEFFKVSGVIASCVCGFVVNQYGRGLINDEELMASYFKLADYLLNTLLFTLGGVIWGALSFGNVSSPAVGMSDWGALFMFYAFIVIIRFGQVGAFYPIISRLGLGTSVKESIFMAWAGLHGSVGVALGLAMVRYVFQNTELTSDPDSKDFQIRQAATIIQFLGGGATLLTLSINGTTCGWALKKLGLSKPAVPLEHVKQVFEGVSKDFVYKQIEQLFEEPRFQKISFDTLEEFVPFVTKEPPRTGTGAKHLGHSGHTAGVFHDRVAGGGDRFIGLLQAGKAAAKTKRRNPKAEKLVQEMRQIFLELLIDAYKLKVELGEIDEKNHTLFNILNESANLALNDVRYNDKEISDWEHAQNLSGYNSRKQGVFGRNSIITMVRKSVMPTVRMSVMPNMSAEAAQQDVISVKSIALDVVRAIAFKHAHALAEAKLQRYVDRFDDEDDAAMKAVHEITQVALKTVIEESHEQVALAEDLLEEEISEAELQIILAHYAARVLLRKLVRFTEEKAEHGMLGKELARDYEDDLMSRVKKLTPSVIERLAECKAEMGTAQDQWKNELEVFGEEEEEEEGEPDESTPLV
jgi:NhaP-type Na+/H+ or K+/H+ antiporter